MTPHDGDPRQVIPLPDPDLKPDDIVARARGFRDQLLSEQDASDERGTYSDSLHDQFRAAGLYRILQPRLFGGYEFDVPTFYRTMVEIARGHPSAGWCLTLCASHPFLIASHWSFAAQKEFFGPDGHFAAPHRVPPQGVLTPAPGGYRLSGKWDYCSGIPHSSHLVCGARLAEAGAETADKTAAHPLLYSVVVPRKLLRVLDDWGGDRTIGMRASGSNSVEISDIFVPAHHVVASRGLFLDPEEIVDGTPGTRLHGNPMYLGRVSGVYHMSLVAPVVGAALAAADEFAQIIRTKPTMFPPFAPRALHGDFQRALGEGLALAEAAYNLLIRCGELYMERCQRWDADGRIFTVEDSLQLWVLVQQAGRLACDAVERLFRASGASAARKGSRIERYFRDVQMYRVHPSSQFSDFWGPLGRARLGLPINHFDF